LRTVTLASYNRQTHSWSKGERADLVCSLLCFKNSREATICNRKRTLLAQPMGRVRFHEKAI